MLAMNQSLNELKDQVLKCTNCSLAYTRRQVIFGEGNPRASIMVVGEAPGYDEDIQGRPFVGKSGQLLDKILAACGFSRTEHVYISNIVKCHPPENRVPTLNEAEICMPYLLKQIEIIDPKILILLGATSLKYMAGNTYRITRDRGKWIPVNGRLAMPVFHPAALLRNPALKRPTWDDYKEVVRKYRELVDTNHKSDYV